MGPSARALLKCKVKVIQHSIKDALDPRVVFFLKLCRIEVFLERDAGVNIVPNVADLLDHVLNCITARRGYSHVAVVARARRGNHNRSDVGPRAGGPCFELWFLFL